uniref:protein TIC 100 n=1 Tax=Erigeron canadensis TaxID=72917 RepID=UPI001CB9094E|nr:protein TIC 100 [Erigeron canadensis]
MSSKKPDQDDSSSDTEEPYPDTKKPEVTTIRPNNSIINNKNKKIDADDDDTTPEGYFKKVSQILESEEFKKLEESQEVNDVDNIGDLYDFPEDPENWKEEDLKELWADAPPFMTKPGFDPSFVDKDELDIINEEIREGRDPPIAPFYVPYRKHYPVIPHNHYDIRNAKSVIEELDRIEETLQWHSFVFADGSTYEGTVWDDLAHGKGVYEAEQGLVRYEGEWLQNNPEGHGVLEVDIPTYEPIPGSELEAEMRAKGHIFKRDFMSPEDKEWLEKDIEDCVKFSRGRYEIPFYENEEWVRQFGEKPEKGRYRYAGQWKHGRMHGCGVFELNERTTYGRFYFGQFLEEDHGCDVDTSALHSGIADVAAAKARMFVNKPDGMVREERGPYNDPQHPYLYEGEDVWMAPGFINQFCEVPDYWKAYMEDVDEERQMWLNSFYKAPLRLPMPAELEHWWEKDESPEFILLNKEPEPDPEDPSKMVYTEDPVILHTPTGRIINYVDDEEHGIRLFWQPPLKDGEDVDASKVTFLPLGDEELFERDDRNVLERTVTSLQDKCKLMLENLEKWREEKKKESEVKLKLIETEIEIVEAESELKEIIKEMDDELKKLEKEEEKKMEMGLEDEDEDEPVEKSEEVPHVEIKVDEVKNDGDGDDADDEDEDEEEDEEDDDDENTPPSFGSVIKDQDSTKNDQKGKNGGRSSPFASSSLQFSSVGLVSMVPSQLQQLLGAWKASRLHTKTSLPCSSQVMRDQLTRKCSISFERTFDQGLTMRAHHQTNKLITKSTHGNRLKHKASAHLQSNTGEPNRHSLTWPCIRPDEELSILSLHIPI